MANDLPAKSIELLRFIATQPGRKATMSQIIAFVCDEKTASYRVKQLEDAEYIDATDFEHYSPKDWHAEIISISLIPIEYGLTAAGEDYLASLDQMLKEHREREAKEEAKRREDNARALKQDRKNRHHDYFVAAFEVLLGFFLGVVSEHYVQIVAFIQKLFH